jgi:hypothetical protein
VVVSASALDMDSLQCEVSFLRKHMAILKFAVALPPKIRHTDWIRELEDKLGDRIELYKEASNGFFNLQLGTPEFLQRLVGFTSYKISGGVARIHTWVLAFNSHHPIGLASPTWITLHNLPLEYLTSTRNMAESVGMVLEAPKETSGRRDPRFCILEKPAG